VGPEAAEAGLQAALVVRAKGVTRGRV
jgi:hypothetical protein